MSNTKIYTEIPLPDRNFTKIQDTKRMISINGLEDGSHSVTFSTTIPVHIYNIVADKHVEYVADSPIRAKHQPVVTFNRNGKLARIVSADSLETLIQKLTKIGSDAKVVSDLEKLANGDLQFGDKLLAVKFSGSESKEKSSYNHASLGLKQTTHFQWCIAYRFEKESWYNKEISYGFHSGQMDSSSGKCRWFDNITSADPNTFFDPSFTLIPWTAEREEFLKSLQGNFTDMISTLNDFLQNLDETKLEQLMTNSVETPLLSAPPKKPKSIR